MKRRIFLSLLLVMIVAAAANAHDLFLRLSSFFVPPNRAVQLKVLNGTFHKSENSVVWERVRDLRIITPARIIRLDSTAWSARGDTSIFAFNTGGSGTYVVGLSTLPRALRLEAEQFNGYLAEDGLPDVLAARRQAGELDEPARERYSKHVKAILQVGKSRTSTFSTTLGYPAELVPLDQPYSLRPQSVLRIKVLVDGKPSANELVTWGGVSASGKSIEERSVRSDADGVARVRIASRGQTYVKFIHMVRVQEDSVDYESKWATLTFEVR